MKPYLLLLAIPLFLAACGGSEPQVDGNPKDLEGKKDQLQKKLQEYQKLQEEIAQLEAEIQILEPAAVKTALVTTSTLQRKDFKHFVEVQGSVQSDNVVNVSSETGGRILDLKVVEGQNVSKGQLIAKLDLEAIDKQIAELETSLQLAVEVYERQKRLWEQNIGSEIQYLQAKNNKERLEKGLETLKFQRNKSNIYAPISGVVERVVLKTGEIAGPGTPICMILNTSQVKVVAAVPEAYVKNVRKGDQVIVSFPALNTEKQARITLVGSTINSANRTFVIEMDLPNGGGDLKPNLLATVLINDHTEKNAVVVPLELVQQEIGGKDFVFVKSSSADGDRAQKVYVELGQSYKGEIIITSGLKGGEELILDGARSLTDQEPVEIKKG